MKILLTHGHLIVDDFNEYLDGALLIEGERIVDVYSQSSKVKVDDDTKAIDLKGSLVMPGFFDSHSHGAMNVSFDNGDKKGLDVIDEFFAKSGTTSYLASVSYDLTYDEYMARCAFLDKYESPLSRFQGIHLEGPFLSPKHLGVGDPEKFLKPDLKMVEDFLKNTSKIKQMTLALELPEAKKVAFLLKENGIRVMVGHSDALWSDLNGDVDGFTHLYNAMRSLHHRDESLVNAAFSSKYYCEIITDGNHVKKDVLKLTLNNIDRNKIIVVSDSSIAAGLPDGEYEFISKKCTKKGTDFISFDGHYAGSVVTINDELKVLYSLGYKYTDLLLYSSLNAFRLYGLDKQYGSLQKGKYADIVIMDDELNIKNVYVKGRFIYD